MAGDDQWQGRGRLDTLGSWNEQQAADFEQARAAIGVVIAAYSSRMGRTEDAVERDALRAAQQRYARERRLLTVDDPEQIERILREYPARARDVSGL